MADLQISQLPQLAEADLGAADELAIVDDSASETKRITAKALVERGVALIDAGSIPGTALASLGAGTVNTAAVADDAITAAKIVAGAVGASEIADGSITATEIAANTITAGQIAANAIGASELADDAVDTAAVADSAITNQKIANGTIAFAKLNLSDGDIAGAKIANNSITAGQIAADAVGASELANDAVDTNAIANVAVTGSKIASNAITNIKITDATITGAKLVNNTITATQIAANAITASELADDAVDTAAILDDAVTSGKLAAGAVDTTALGAAAVTGAKIAGTTITAANIAAGTITATELAANSVGASEIAANAVGASELADDAVDTAAIVNAAVTNAKIADATITYAKLNLADGDIPAAKIASGAIGNAQIAANAVGATELANDAVDTAAIQNLAVTGAKIAATTITGAKIAATTIEAGNIAANTITASEIAANAIGSSELADNAVDTAAIVNAAVTNDKIANTTIAYAKLNLSAGDIAGAKIADNSLTANQIAANAIGSSELADNAVDTNAIADDAVTGAKIAATTIEGANIVTGTITATQLAADSVGASEIAANAVGASELADDAVDTAAIANLAVTGAKIANATVTAAKLSLSAGDIDGTKIANDSLTATQIAANAITASELADNAVDTAALAANSVTAAKIAANAVGASELADDAVDTAAVANGAITTAKIADGAVTAAKLSGTIEAGTLAANSVTTAKIADDAVTAAKLGTGAVDTTALGATSVTTAKIAAGAVTDAKVGSGISGTKLTDATITAAKLNTANIDRSLNVASGNLGINNVISAGTSAGISYNAQGLITATTALVASDLPVATVSAVGGVSVPTAGGLAITGAGALSIAATTTGATATKVTFNNFGQITGTATLAASDLPVATASAVGAVSVPTGGPLTVDSNGAITVSDSGVTAGTNTKVTVDAKGRVTALAALAASDIPNHSAALITSGSITAARIGNSTISGAKLANASTTLFGSVAQTGFPTSEFTGQFFFDSVSEDLYIYDGNAYQPVTTLTKGSLVFGGTYNASTSKVASVTTAGAAAGLTVGSNVPTPTTSTDGLYLVVENAGTPSAPAPVVQLAPPDYILGVTNTAGSSWEEIDLSQTVAGQVASNITFTPYGQISATNVQDALQELETEKLGKAGGTVTGEVLISNTGTLVFEGSSIDAFQTTLGVVNPTTADKTILLPNTSGTLITTNDSGTITSAMIADGTIVNGDISSSAAIAFSKLAALPSTQILVGNGSGVAAAVAVTGDISISNSGVVGISSGVIVDGDISGSAAITGSKIATGTTSAVGVLQLTDSATSTSATTAATPAAVKIAKDAADAAATTANAALPKAGGTLTDNLIIDNAKSIRLSEADSNGAHYLALKAPDSVTADITFTLPDGDGSSGQRLQTDGSGNLSWGTDNATDPTKLPLAGGTMTGAIAMGTSKITGLGDPTAAQDAATKTYVDAASTTGNAATATALATARTIGGVSFDGTANIDLPGVNAAGNQSTTGNAATATKFASTQLIGGVAFDGSGPINLPGVNTAGTQDTSGTAALATQFTVTANNSTDETVYPIFVDAATGSQGAETDSALTYNPSTGALTTTTFIGALTGNVTGNVSGSAGSCTGNAATATALATARAINGVNFDGSAAITVTAAAGTLTGATLASGVTASSLTSVGTLTGLTTSGDITLNAQSDLRFADSDSSNYVGFQSPATVSSNVVWTLPDADGSANQVLKTDGSGNLSWLTVATSAADLTGTTIASNVVASSLTSVGTLTSLAVSGNATVGGNATITGNLVVNGTTTTVSSTTVEVADKNIEIGKVSSPSDTTADGGGLTLLGATNKTFNWVNSTDAWTSSEHIQVASGKTFIGDGSTLTALNASNLSSGTVATARLGSGTASSSNFLRGDGSWQTVSGTTINNNANNRLITGSGTANTLEAEATLTFNPGSGILATPVVTLSDSLKTSARVKVHTGATAQYETIDFDTNGETNFLYQNAARIQVISGGVRFYGDEVEINSDLELKGATTGRNVVWDKSDDALEFADDAKAAFGSGSDFQIVHTGSACTLINSTGTTTLGSAGVFTITNESANSTRLTATHAGSVDLYFSGGKKLETTNTGVSITGNITLSGTVDGIDIATDVAANTAKVTNATHSGEVTGATALTIADNVVDEANLKVSNSPTNGYFLSAQSGNTGGLTWAAVTSTPEGTAILSTGITTNTKYLRADGDGTCSWQFLQTDNIKVQNESGDTECFPTFGKTATGDTIQLHSNTALKFNTANGALTATSFVGSGASLTNLPGGVQGQAFYESLGNVTVSSSYSISANSVANTYGTTSLNSGVTITVPSTSTWITVGF